MDTFLLGCWLISMASRGGGGRHTPVLASIAATWKRGGGNTEKSAAMSSARHRR